MFMVDRPKYKFHKLASIVSLSHSSHRHPNNYIHISRSITLLCGLKTQCAQQSSAAIELSCNAHAANTATCSEASVRSRR